MANFRELDKKELTWRMDEAALGFDNTGSVEASEGTLGQKRALDALEFGLGIKSFGYNLYVMGQPGTGKSSTVKRVLELKSKEGPGPQDWMYVMDFKEPDKPYIIGLPRGKGCELSADMDVLIEQLKKAIPKVFEGEEFERKREELFTVHNRETNDVLEGLGKDAQKRGFSMERTSHGVAIVPKKKDGKLMSQEEFEQQEPYVKQMIEEQGGQLQGRLGEAMRRIRDMEKGLSEKLRELNREFGDSAAGHFIGDLIVKYKEYPKVKEYFEQVREDILEHLDDFKAQSQQGPPVPFMPQREPSFDRYKMNLLVDNCTAGGAPVVFETNPSYPNLFGRIEQRVQYGLATTDFTMIRPGALHKANGGYLVIDVMDLLRNPFAYDGLKRALKNREIAIEDALEQYRMMSIYTLKPQPVPLDVKVVLIGPPGVYYLLHALDEEYRKLFKVRVDFDTRIARDQRTVEAFAGSIAAKVREEGLLPFSRSGVARVVEYAARLASDKEKLTLRFLDILDLMREASYWAGLSGAGEVAGEHVERAIREWVYRASMIEDKIKEAIAEGVIIVDIAGGVVGQVNGLSVISLGGYSFGRPSRITARTYMGRGGMVNIEREVKMSGPIHDKGVLILNGYLGSKYAADKPLAFSASIAFEQSYEGVEGDSASSAELYALLSSLSGVPIRQGIAVTGSVNQLGEVQPIGGVNEKVEGYFEVCKTLGLTGDQGVMVPERNVRHLMLKDEVVNAVNEGRFHVWAVKDIDAGIELLTGMAAGLRRADGSYPEDTINRLVDERLYRMAREMAAFAREEHEAGRESERQAA